MARIFIIMATYFMSSIAVAAYSNYNTILLGLESSGLGGAYTAGVGDISAAAFYNPASLGRIPGDSISGSATIYNKFDTTYGESADVLTAGERINRGFFRTIPSAMGNVFRYGEWSIALSILVPDYEYFSGTIATSVTTQTFLNTSDESLWSGVAVSRNLNPNHSLGLTTYYTARNFVRSMTDRLIINSSREILTYEEKSIKSNSLVFILGYLWQASPQWRWGISLRAPSVRASGRGSYYLSTTDTDNLPSSVVFHKNIQARTYIPPKLTLGSSWQVNSRLRFQMDLSGYGALGYKDMAQDEASDLVEYAPTWNASLGMAYDFKHPKMQLRAGIFTNNSSHDKPSQTNFYRRGESMDATGLSANIAFKTNKNVQYTVGGFYTGGKGKSVQRSGNAFVVIDKTQHLFSLLIGTSYMF